MQLIEAESNGDIQLEQIKHKNDMEKMQVEFQMKSELIKLQQGFQGQMKQSEIELKNQKEEEKEDRKDKRTKIQATQQSKMINQRQQDLDPIDFDEDDNIGEFDNLFKIE
jgi:hypothetical protein